LHVTVEVVIVSVAYRAVAGVSAYTSANRIFARSPTQAAPAHQAHAEPALSRSLICAL